MFDALTLLAFSGGALGWLAGATEPARFAWLFCWRRAWLWVAYLVVFPAYSAIASIPALHLSLASTHEEEGAAGLVLKVAGERRAGSAFI